MIERAAEDLVYLKNNAFCEACYDISISQHRRYEEQITTWYGIRCWVFFLLC